MDIILPKPWHKLVEVSQTGSTQADLVGHAQAGAQSGLVLLAHEQVQGRGRLERAWESPAGQGLWFSLLLRSPRAVADLGIVPLLTAVAIAQALADEFGLSASVKWPNDILINRKKLSGILVNHCPPDALIIGVGINTMMSQPPIDMATSLLLEDAIGSDQDVPHFFTTVLASIGSMLSDLAVDQPWPLDVLDPYRRLSSTLGSTVDVTLPSGQVLTGQAVDIEPTGALVVSTSAGQRVCVTAGDVVQVR